MNEQMIYPFAIEHDYTMVHNQIIDVLLPKIGGISFAVLCYLIRSDIPQNPEAIIEAINERPSVVMNILNYLEKAKMVEFDSENGWYLNVGYQVDKDLKVFNG